MRDKFVENFKKVVLIFRDFGMMFLFIDNKRLVFKCRQVYFGNFFKNFQVEFVILILRFVREL